VAIDKIFLIFASGILMAMGCEPFDWWVLSWFSLVPLWLLINNNTSVRKNLIMGLVWGLGYHGLTISWILGIHPMTWLGVPWLASLLIALVCWLLISLWGASLVILWTMAMTFFQVNESRLPYCRVFVKIIIGTAIWSGLEQLYSLTPLWWSSLSLTQSPHNLTILQLGTISGPLTITAALVVINGLIAEAIIMYQVKQKKNSQILILTAILCYGFFSGVGWLLYQRPLSSEKALKIGLIQGNIRNEIKLNPEGFTKAIEGYTTGYNQLAKEGVQLVITPETALPFFWDSLTKYGSFYPAVKQAGIPVILGAFGSINNDYTNSLFMIDAEGKIMGIYDKSKLVPLGEYIPFEEILGKIIQRLSPLKTRLRAGKNNQIIESPFGKVILGICYESAYPEIFRRQTRAGGEYIVTASNDAHYSLAMPAQHNAQDVMRAIENDRWAARVTNTGYSAIVTPRGDVIWRSSLNTYTTHTATIYTQDTKTLYVRFGNWLTVLLLGLAGVLYKIFESKKKI